MTGPAPGSVPPAGRCFGDGTPLYEDYHDLEWGRPRLTEQALFEKVCLEGFQAGLSWITVLRKREALREALAGFDPDSLAGWDPVRDVEPLLGDARLIRSGAKLRSCLTNARATVALREQGGLPALLWSYAEVPGPAPRSWADVPASTPASVEAARRLKRLGFSFVGPTTVYALMQACGLVDDHVASCPVRAEVEAERQRAHRP